jgi:hypothetical protein
MQDNPSAVELLDAVIHFLKEVAPVLPPREAFDARVASNALALVRREIAIGREAQSEELCRLVALLGHNGELRDLNQELSERLLNGQLTGNDPQVKAHLWATTLEKLAVDQPDYSAYQRSVNETNPLE